LITIPQVWRGSPDELEEPHTSAVARLAERHGPASEARAITRTINVTDRLLVLARPLIEPQAALRLAPPEGGYLVTNLALPDAMRLLGGRNRRAAAAGVIGVWVGIGLAFVGATGAVVSLVLA
jgi:hypothetical protein